MRFMYRIIDCSLILGIETPCIREHKSKDKTYEELRHDRLLSVLILHGSDLFPDP